VDSIGNVLFLAGARRRVTDAQACYLGAGAVIDSVAIAVREKFRLGPHKDEYVLYLSLEELRVSGEAVFLGDWKRVVGLLPILTLDSPDRSPVVEVEVGTDSVDDGGKIDVCVEVGKYTKQGDIQVVASLECRTLTPVIPL